jgi:hypothetical protein
MRPFDIPRLLRLVRAGVDERLVRRAALRQAARPRPSAPAPASPLPPKPALPPLRLAVALRALLRLLGIGGPQRVERAQALPPLALPGPEASGQSGRTQLLPEAETGRIVNVRDTSASGVRTPGAPDSTNAGSGEPSSPR